MNTNTNFTTSKDIWLDEFDYEPVHMTRTGYTFQVTKVEVADNGEEVCFFGRRLNKNGMTKQVYTIRSFFGGDVEAKLNRLNIPEWLMSEIMEVK